MEWKAWSRMTEKGVDSMWAVNAMDANCPGRRSLLAEIGRNWPKEFQNEIDPLGLSFVLQENTRAVIQRIFDSVFYSKSGIDYVTINDIYTIQDWLWGRAGTYLPPKDLTIPS
jgi:hypothetical protein